MSTASQSLPTSTWSSFSDVGKRFYRLCARPQHPPGFYVVCLAVLCERFAAYILASSAVLMLCERYGYARADALRLAGLVNAVSYLGTLPGGLTSDRVLGARRALRISVMLLALGYAALTLSGRLALWLSLGLLVLGSSLFKPATQASIAELYAPTDPRLDAAQIIFYLAINSGAALGGLIAGVIIRSKGWNCAYTLATAIMLTGRIVLFVGRDASCLRPADGHTIRSSVPSPSILPARKRAKIVGALTLAMFIYTICYAQVEGSLLLWAQDRVERVVLGFEIPAAWFVALPAVLALVLAPLQLALLAHLQRCIGTQRLIAGGLLAVALAYVTLIPALTANAAQRVSMGWLVGCLALLVIGELLVGPLGLSLLLRLAPPRLVGVVAGAWYLSGALGFWLAGELGALWLQWSSSGMLALLVMLPLCGAGMLWMAAPTARYSTCFLKKPRST